MSDQKQALRLAADALREACAYASQLVFGIEGLSAEAHAEHFMLTSSWKKIASQLEKLLEEK